MVRIVDYSDNLRLSDERVEEQFDAIRSLDYLTVGLWFLYEEVKRMEEEAVKALTKDRKVSIFGNYGQMKGINRDLAACAFHWYAVTVCNYVRLVGWLAYEGNKAEAVAYLRRVLPEVHVWRNKIGAHFARHSPENEDTPADVRMSVIFPIKWEIDAFYSPPFKLTVTGMGKKSVSRQDMTWSLTKTHCELVPRYWPERRAK